MLTPNFNFPISIFLKVCFLLLVPCLLAAQPRGSLVIIGGGSRPSSIIDRIIAESHIKEAGYGVVLPMSSAEADSSVYYAVQPFLKAGVTTLVGMNFKKGEVQKVSSLDSVRKAHLIYITGGDQARFMDVVQGTPLELAIQDAHRQGAVITGTSAGAAVMSEVMITGNQIQDTSYTSTFKTIAPRNLETRPGLGLVKNVLIDQHFLIRSRHNRLITGVIDFPMLKGIGIDESTAIVVKGQRVEVIGESQVILIENPSRSRREANNKLGASALTLSVHLPGDQFSIAPAKTTSKAPVKKSN